jgi:inorganic pyrophosphatase
LLSAKLESQDDDRRFCLSNVKSTEVGKPGTLEYRINYYYKNPSGQLKRISPWHDIPLYSLGLGEDGQIFHFVCEIPKWTRAKFEIATGMLILSCLCVFCSITWIKLVVKLKKLEHGH